MKQRSSLEDIQVIEAKGPWHSKSGGKLNVLFALPQEAVERFLDVKNPAFDEVPQNIRGLRVYTVESIPAGSIGGKEWHKARTELLHAVTGSALLECVDIDGNEREYVLDGTSSVIIPPNILHTYQALENNTTLQVVANTLFIPEDALTHDTYPIETFE